MRTVQLIHRGGACQSANIHIGDIMSELERIPRLAKERCQEGRSKPAIRKDDKYVIDLIYLLEQSTIIIDKLCEGKTAVSDDVLTIKGMQDIAASIGDEHLNAFFTAKVCEALGVNQPREPLRISDG